MQRQLWSAWTSAIEQLGPGGAVIAASVVVGVIGILLLAVLGLIVTRAMRRYEESREPLPPKPARLSPVRRLELRRLIDERIGIEAARHVDSRRDWTDSPKAWRRR